MTTATHAVPIVELPGDLHADPLAYLTAGHRRRGDVFAVAVDGVPTAIFGGLTGAKHLFAAERQHLRVVNTINVLALFREAVFNLKGEEHKRARRALLTALTGPWLAEVRPELAGLARRHVQHWGKCGTVDLVAACRSLTLAVCAKVILGLPDHGAERRAFPTLFDAFAAATGPDADEQVFQAGFAAASSLRRIVDQRVFGAEPDGVDVVSRLIRAGQVPPESIADQALAMMIATRETTASLLTWMLMELAADVDLALPAGAGASAPELMQQVLWETERLHSPNILSTRRVVADLPTPAGLVPAGWHAAYSPAANHLLPEVFDDPFQFRPARFRGVEPPHSHRLYTFGQGAHACPGKPLAELFATQVATEAVTTFRLTLIEPRPSKVRFWPVKTPAAPVFVELDPWERR